MKQRQMICQCNTLRCVQCHSNQTQMEVSRTWMSNRRVIGCVNFYITTRGRKTTGFAQPRAQVLFILLHAIHVTLTLLDTAIFTLLKGHLSGRSILQTCFLNFMFLLPRKLQTSDVHWIKNYSTTCLFLYSVKVHVILNVLGRSQ